MHRSRLLVPALALLLAACGGSDPIQPPATLTAVVTLKANEVMTFVGRPVALRDLVQSVTDAQGNPLVDYRLSAELPAGWTLRNDTVIPPAHETVARLKVNATYQAPASRAVDLPLFNLAGFSSSTDTATVTNALNLSDRRWRISFMCADSGRGRFLPPGDGNEYLDSAGVVDAVVDTVIYPGDSGWVVRYGGTASIRMSGTATYWLKDGTVRTWPWDNIQIIHRQAPDSIFAGPVTPNMKPMLRVTPGTLNQLLRYEGGTFCGEDWRLKRGPVTFRQVAP